MEWRNEPFVVDVDRPRLHFIAVASHVEKNENAYVQGYVHCSTIKIATM